MHDRDRRYPTRDDKVRLKTETGIELKQIEIWFKDMRSRKYRKLGSGPGQRAPRDPFEAQLCALLKDGAARVRPAPAKALTLGQMVARGLVAPGAGVISLARRPDVVADLLSGGAIRHGAATYASPTAFATAVIGKSVRKGLKAVTYNGANLDELRGAAVRGTAAAPAPPAEGAPPGMFVPAATDGGFAAARGSMPHFGFEGGSAAAQSFGAASGFPGGSALTQQHSVASAARPSQWAANVYAPPQQSLRGELSAAAALVPAAPQSIAPLVEVAPAIVNRIRKHSESVAAPPPPPKRQCVG